MLQVENSKFVMKYKIVYKMKVLASLLGYYR